MKEQNLFWETTETTYAAEACISYIITSDKIGFAVGHKKGGNCESSPSRPVNLS